MPQYVQYIVANKGLGMSAGKLAAQVAHASVKGYQMSLRTRRRRGRGGPRVG
jgi:peptidyl-tRNA hydrolase